MPETQKKSKLGLALIACGIIVIGGMIIMTSEKAQPIPDDVAVAESTPAAGTAETQTETSSATTESPTPTETVTLSAEEITKLGTPRIIGNPSAPLKITEHSSFTCGACAAYHKGNFKNIKADYIDTGKAYLVFDDFPRNANDIIVGSIARCVPEESYFNFVQLLFETQHDWANADYQKHVIQNAMITGLSKERAEACMKNEALQKALADSREKAQKDFNVDSTPTLIINNSRSISGLTPYDELKKIFDEELAKKAAPAAP